MDTAESAGGKDTMKHTQEKLIDEKNKQQNNKKNLKVQINDDPIERHISEDGDEYYEFKEHSDEKIIINVDNGDDDGKMNLTHSVELHVDDEDVPVRGLATRLNEDTQTQSDLEQLRNLYLKNLEAGIAANFEGSSKLNRFDDTSSNYIKIITNELEERALHDILNDLKINTPDNNKQIPIGANTKKFANSSANRKPVTTKPPKTTNKYTHVKSSGYGKPQWTRNENGVLEIDYSRPAVVDSKHDETYLKLSQSFKSERNLNAMHDMDYLMKQISNLMEEREKDRILLVKLRGKLNEWPRNQSRVYQKEVRTKKYFSPFFVIFLKKSLLNVNVSTNKIWNPIRSKMISI